MLSCKNIINITITIAIRGLRTISSSSLWTVARKTHGGTLKVQKTELMSYRSNIHVTFSIVDTLMKTQRFVKISLCRFLETRNSLSNRDTCKHLIRRCSRDGVTLQFQRLNKKTFRAFQLRGLLKDRTRASAYKVDEMFTTFLIYRLKMTLHI